MRRGIINRICISAATLVAVLASVPATGAAVAGPRAVYTETNLPAGNSVLWFARSGSGSLTQMRSYPTGGKGSPNSHAPHFPMVDSQNSVVINPQKTFLFAVNHGSGTITSFRIRRNGSLQPAEVVSSGGTGPASLAIRGDGLMYVVNEAPPANIRGYRVTASGLMRPISGTAKMLANPNASPGQVGFDHTGRFLVLSDRFGGTSDADPDYFEIFRLSRAGLPTALSPVRSLQQEPYAFSFTSRNEMLVTNGANNAPGASITSSYLLSGSGGLSQVAAQPTGQRSGCWLVTSANDRFAFVSNGGSLTILAYSLSPGGSFTNISPGGAIMISGLGGDLALTPRSDFLYVLTVDPSLFLSMNLNARDSIDGFRVGPNGSLTRVGTFAMGQLPFASSGLAAL